MSSERVQLSSDVGSETDATCLSGQLNTFRNKPHILLLIIESLNAVGFCKWQLQYPQATCASHFLVQSRGFTNLFICRTILTSKYFDATLYTNYKLINRFLLEMKVRSIRNHYKAVTLQCLVVLASQKLKIVFMYPENDVLVRKVITMES